MAGNTTEPMSLSLTFDEAAARLMRDAIDLRRKLNRRILYGIAGGPGAGKSTLAAHLAGLLNAAGEHAAVLPMDGFHMRHAKLEHLGLASRKGAPETFEAAAFVEHLVRVRDANGAVTGPGYSRKIEDVVDNAATIPAEARIVLVEGNYLLLPEAPWRDVRPTLDRSVFIDVPRNTVRARLLRRHAAEGLFSEERNRAYVENVDLPNYDNVARSKSLADIAIAIRLPGEVPS
jgi:pantothenate kinase